MSNRPPTEQGTSAEGLAWLTDMARQEGTIGLPCGLMYRVLKTGPPGASSPRLTSHCACHYRSMLIDGTEFDSSYARGEPAVIAPNKVIQGWTVAMQLMGEGDKWELYVPSELAYGDAGRSDAERGQYIPSGAALKFELEIVQVGGPCKCRPERPPPPEGFALERVFSGSREDVVFTTGLWGTGYYPDRLPISVTLAQEPDVEAEKLPAASPAAAKRRSPRGDDATDSAALFERTPLRERALPPSAQAAVRKAAGGKGTLKGAAPPLAPSQPPRPPAAATSLEKPPPLQEPPQQQPLPPPTDEGQEVLPTDVTSLQALVARQREIIEEATQVALQSLLTKLTLPTLKQALNDFDIQAEGSKEELSQRLSRVLSER